MAVGKGGSLNNQNQSQSGSYSSQGSSSQTTTPIAPEGWQTAWQGYQPGSGGFNPTQQGAVNWFQNSLSNPDPAGIQGARDGVNWAGNYLQDAVANRTAPTLRNLSQIDPAAYGAPTPVSAQQAAGRSAADFMGRYQQPYTEQVLGSALANYDEGVARGANAFRANSIAGGASGAGSNPVGAAILAGEAARGRGALTSGILSDAFNTAAGFGAGDAQLAQGADLANASNSLAAQQFNNNLTNQRQMFDSQTGMAYNDQRDRTARDYINSQTTSAGLGTTGYGINQGLASGLFGMGTTGQGQNLDWLGAALPLFGQTSTGTTSESGSTVGNSSGSARGKSGGISLQ